MHTPEALPAGFSGKPAGRWSAYRLSSGHNDRDVTSMPISARSGSHVTPIDEWTRSRQESRDCASRPRPHDLRAGARAVLTVGARARAPLAYIWRTAERRTQTRCIEKEVGQKKTTALGPHKSFSEFEIQICTRAQMYMKVGI